MKTKRFTKSKGKIILTANKRKTLIAKFSFSTDKKKSKKKQKENEKSSSKLPNIKCVVVGDACVGKTNLIVSYLDNRFISEHNPTASDIYNGKCFSSSFQSNLACSWKFL